MTNKETIERNIGLTFHLVDQLIDSPKNLEKIPDKSMIQFVEKDFLMVEFPCGKQPKNNIKNKKVRVSNSFELRF